MQPHCGRGCPVVTTPTAHSLVPVVGFGERMISREGRQTSTPGRDRIWAAKSR